MSKIICFFLMIFSMVFSNWSIEHSSALFRSGFFSWFLRRSTENQWNINASVFAILFLAKYFSTCRLAPSDLEFIFHFSPSAHTIWRILQEKSYSNENAWKSTVERYKIPSEHSFQFVPPGPTMPSQCDSLPPLLQLLNLKHQADPLHVCNQLL
jgi:hypothetical protein